MARVPRNGVPVLLALILTVGCASTRDRRTAYLHMIHPDQRPPIGEAYAGADSLFGAAEASDRGDGIAEDHRAALEALVQRFTPTLVLPSGDAARRGRRTYQLLPTDPRLFGRTLRVDRIAPAPYALSDSHSVGLATASTDSLARLVGSALEYRIRRALAPRK